MEKRPLNILLVDDDEFFADIVANQLQEELKHHVTIARNGKQAMELIKSSKNHFDIILTDYFMPEVTGLDLLQWIHDNKIETPVVMLTAVGTDLVAVDVMKLGAYDYVRKEQLDLQHLGIVIDATMERYNYRVNKSIDDERANEIKLNKLATDKVRDVLNAITPTINNAFANINADIETKGEKICKKISSPQKEQLSELLKSIQKEAVTLETSIRGLLGLYRMLYAHHAEATEIDKLKQEIVASVSNGSN